jgi:hypothetical protein
VVAAGSGGAVSGTSSMPKSAFSAIASSNAMIVVPVAGPVRRYPLLHYNDNVLL